MKVFTLFGIDIKISFWLIVTIPFMIFLFDINIAVAFSIAIFFHELCHCIMAKLMGVGVYDILLMPFGAMANISDELTINPFYEIPIGLAGPVGSLFLGCVCVALSQYFISFNKFLMLFAQCNLMLCFFNLLPCLPLDGGRVFRGMLSKYMGRKKATIFLATLGQLLGGTLVGIGVYLAFFGEIKITALSMGVLLLVISSREKIELPFTVYKNSQTREKYLSSGKILQGRTIVVRKNTPLLKIYNKFIHGKYNMVCVVDENGEIISRYTEEQILSMMISCDVMKKIM